MADQSYALVLQFGCIGMCSIGGSGHASVIRLGAALLGGYVRRPLAGGCVHRQRVPPPCLLMARNPGAGGVSATSRWGASMSPSLPSTAVAVLGDARPPAKTQWPSAWSCSLKASIAAISSAVARSVVSARTESRYCAIGIISSRRVAAPSGAFHPYYERRCLEPTRSAEIASRIFARRLAARGHKV